MTLQDRMKTMATAVLIAMTLAGAGNPPATGPQDRPPSAKDKAAPSDPPRPARVGSLIKGLVVDEQRRPVAGARVSPMWAVPPRSTTSRADGSFVLERQDPGAYGRSLLATADGGARQGIVRLHGSSGYRGPRTVVRIVLHPAKDVTVSVVDGRGATVPDAAVIALDQNSSVAEARTDARGTATLRVPAESNMQWIIAFKPGLGFDYFESDPSGGLSPWSRPPARAGPALCSMARGPSASAWSTLRDAPCRGSGWPRP